LAGAAKARDSTALLDAHENSRDEHLSEYKYYARASASWRSIAELTQTRVGKQFMTKPFSDLEIDVLDVARAREYALLAILLLKGPSAALLSDLTRLQGDATPLGRAHSALADAASRASVESIATEHFTLFAGLRERWLWPCASHYLTDTVYGRPLARLRETLRAFHIEKAPGRTEPEDHIGLLCEIMAGFARAEIPRLPGVDRIFFEKHLAPWARRFFVDLEKASISTFYRAVGTLGRTFIDIETDAFGLASSASDHFSNALQSS
jgi:TorA maturation chaperone TorD